MKDNKILYINYILQKGHINFDCIHIDALIRQKVDIRIVVHKKIADSLPFSKNYYELILPSLLGIESHNPIVNRLLYIVTLLYIKLRISFSNYDKVVLSSMDEITLGLLPLFKGMYIICHDNGRNIGKGIKGFFLNKLSKNNSFIVFNKEMSKPFKEKGMNTYIISHGCIKPFAKVYVSSLPIDISNYDVIIYHPSNRPNHNFIHELEANHSFHLYLKEKNILLILRDLVAHNNISGNIIYLNQYLSQAQYHYLFQKSDIILLAYQDNFCCRVSGVSFECVANRKKALIKDNPSLSYCRDFYNYDPFFNTIQTLQERIEYLLNHPKACCTARPESLMPDYTQIIAQ
ncbi:MAG: hypothetical protein IIT65_04435 [Lachnospiraceae bacterium]|nr:hypothetical protein [Lachnospiraceae bacterium]